jgi:choline dehydrogenase
MPAKRRPNLQVVTDTLVTRILLEGKRAVGVMTRKGEQQSEYRGRNVILSGGALNSPQLLLLSGIGPADHLRQMGIEVRHDLPGVGRNLQDHPNSATLAKVNLPTLNADIIARVKDSVQWLLQGKGVFTSAAAQAIAFAKTNPGLKYPDSQIHFMPLAFSINQNNRIELMDSTVTLLTNVSHPRSRGYLELRSSDPSDAPMIHPNMLDDPEDMRTLMNAGRRCQALLKTAALKPYVEQEIMPGAGVESDADWESFLRETAASGAHQCGTCKMGVDDMAVVDPQVKVRGIEGLRVADASIMPTLTSGNTSGVCMGIGGRAAQIIARETN